MNNFSYIYIRIKHTGDTKGHFFKTRYLIADDVIFLGKVKDIRFDQLLLRDLKKIRGKVRRTINFKKNQQLNLSLCGEFK